MLLWSHSHRAPQKGFALLITITLLAFMVLLLVSLASLTRVETQVASNTQQVAAARQNALMALNIALGQLQKHAGPDQRVTATADLANGAAVPNPHWVGVYGNTSVANYNQTPSAITPSAPTLLNWLISGNESITYTASTNAASFGQIDSTTVPLSSTIPFKPTDAITVTGGIASATALSDITVGSANKPARLLVGPNTVNSANAASDYVVAPLVDITTPEKNVPGLGSGTTAATIGRYAYWVGDEGVKARVDLRDSYSQQIATADKTAYQINSFITAQRSAVELVDYVGTTPLSADYPAPASSSSLNNILSLNQLSLTGSSTNAQSHLQAAQKRRFHDLTASSYGVLADIYAGGLKKDLTADITDTSTTADASIGRPADTTAIFTPERGTATSPIDNVPTWGQLRSFPRINPTSGKVVPVLPTSTSQGIYPVINYAGLGLDFYIDSTGKPQVALFPNVGLWNPYSTTIKAATYEIGYRVNGGNPIELRVRGWSENIVATLDMSLGVLGGSTAPSGSPGFVRFKITCQDIPPGETHLYRLDSSVAGAAYSPGANNMTRAPSAGSGSPGVGANYVTWTSAAVTTVSPPTTTDTRTFFVWSNGSNTMGLHAAELDVVLGTTGSVTSPSSTTGWYQAELDAKMDKWKPPTILKNFVQVNTMASGYIPAPSSAFRLQAGMESLWGNDNGYDGNPKGAIRASTSQAGGGGRMRWLAMGNVRSPVVRMTSAESANDRGSILFGAVIATAPSGGTDITLMATPYGFLTSIGDSQFSNAGYKPAVLFDVLSSTDRFLSLGQLQHAQLAPYGFYSSYPFGNSYADVRIDRDRHYVSSYVKASPSATSYDDTLYDLSWHLNRAVWDKYFVSGVPSAWTQSDIDGGRILPNGRMAYYARDGAMPSLANVKFNGGTDNAYAKAAANLMVKGSFNINSTSEEAWRAVLASTYQIPANTAYADSGDNIASIAPIPRFSGNQNLSSVATIPANTTNTMTSNWRYLGNRGLLWSSATTSTLPAIVNELARTIVAEIRARGANGPCLSVADFVNRRITSDTAADKDRGIKGTLQTAIDSMVPSSSTLTGAQNSPEVNPWFFTGNGIPVVASDKPVTAWKTEHFLGGSSSVVAPYNGFATRSALSPKYLTQADLLSVLGPILSARSDTFLIRTYGDVKNPITGAITGRAWCEALVQRLPDYINSTADAAEVAPTILTNTDNKKLGRRLKLVSFRWLTPSDI